jgi:predicted nucleotidyltransferase
MTSDLNTAAAAIATVGPVLQQSGVQDVYLYGPRARGNAKPGANWDFMLDFFRPISPNEFKAISQAMTGALQSQTGAASKIYLCSPQYDRPSFIAWVLPQTKLIYPAA